MSGGGEWEVLSMLRVFFITLAIIEGRVLMLPDNAEWAFGRTCRPATWECHFEPITNCRTSLHAPDWKNAPEIHQVNNASLVEHRVVKFGKSYMNADFPPEGWSREGETPPPFSSKDIYWWHAQLIKYTVRPNKRTMKIVEKEMRKVFPPYGYIPHPIISMYVRHGDKFTEATEHPFHEYMALVNTFTQEHPEITNIYLGSDDPAVINEALTNTSYLKYKFYYIKTKRTNEGPMQLVHSFWSGKELIRVSLANLFIQIQGDVFSGTRSSNFCRLIDELRKAGGKARAPYLTPEPYSEFLRE